MSLAQRLNKRITIQSPGTTQDAIGQPVEGWVNVDTVWAAVEDISGREFMAAGGTQNKAMTKITIRHLAGVTPAMRITHGTDIYNIVAVLGQDGRTLLLMCERPE